MAIICPNCKQQYDVTLFEFDSPVHCDCGARIKLDPRKGTVLDTQDTKNKEVGNEQSRDRGRNKWKGEIDPETDPECD